MRTRALVQLRASNQATFAQHNGSMLTVAELVEHIQARDHEFVNALSRLVASLNVDAAA